MPTRRRTMETYDHHRLERHARRIEELRLWRNAYESPVKGWSFSAGDGKTHEIEPGDFWPEIGIPVNLSARARVPEGWTGLLVELELWLGGEGFVEISVEAGVATEGLEPDATTASGERRVASGLNPFHRSFQVLDEARGGEEVGIEAEVVSKGSFGSNFSEPRLERARLVVPETETRALERDLTSIFEACAALDDHEAVPHLLDVLDTGRRPLHRLAHGDRRYPHPIPRGLRQPHRQRGAEPAAALRREGPGHQPDARRALEPATSPRTSRPAPRRSAGGRAQSAPGRRFVPRADKGGVSARRAARAHRARAPGSRVALAPRRDSP